MSSEIISQSLSTLKQISKLSNINRKRAAVIGILKQTIPLWHHTWECPSMVSSRSASNTLNLPGKIQCFRISSQPVQQLPESFPPAQEIPLKLLESPSSRSLIFPSILFPQAKISPAHPLPVAKNAPKISVKQPWKTSSCAASNFYLPPLWFSFSNSLLASSKKTL